MPEFTITIDDGRAAFVPGERLSGTAIWNGKRKPKGLAINLFWHTSGPGDEDLQVVQTMPIPKADASGETAFAFDLPTAPYSFEGELVSLTWAVELVSTGGKATAKQSFVLAPTGKAITLGAAHNVKPEVYRV
jgi:hypothetical protein